MENNEPATYPSQHRSNTLSNDLFDPSIVLGSILRLFPCSWSDEVKWSAPDFRRTESAIFDPETVNDIVQGSADRT